MPRCQLSASASGLGTVSLAESQPATAAPAAAGGERPATSDPEDGAVVQNPDGLAMFSPTRGIDPTEMPQKWHCS